MLDGKSPVSIRRAVFLAEWAYLDGNLDFGDFCRGIDTAVAYLYRFLSVNELGRYKPERTWLLLNISSGPIRETDIGRLPTTFRIREERPILPSISYQRSCGRIRGSAVPCRCTTRCLQRPSEPRPVSPMPRPMSLSGIGMRIICIRKSG